MYICARIKNNTRYTAFFLLALFCVTWVPVNLFHEHEEEAHTVALLTHDTGHQCDFDLNYCTDHDAGFCGHNQHLEKTHTHCFSCQFHFTKEYLYGIQQTTETVAVQGANKPVFIPGHPIVFAARISSRGPPAIA